MYGKGKKPRLSGEHKGYHGSSKETHKMHGGEMAGTRELGVGSMPGKAAMRIKPKEAMGAIDRDSGKSSFKPKGLKVYSEE